MRARRAIRRRPELDTPLPPLPDLCDGLLRLGFDDALDRAARHPGRHPRAQRWLQSIGHGFYLEDGTEINNTLCANLGIFARAAVSNVQNLRKVPGILAAPDLYPIPAEYFPYQSDDDHPTVFWIMNGWNDFQDNMAAGAGTCGAATGCARINSTMSAGSEVGVYACIQRESTRGRIDAAQVVRRATPAPRR